MTTPSIKPYKPLLDWLGLAMRLIYLGGFLFGLHTQLINFADDILWVKVLGYLSMLPLLKWIVRETGNLGSRHRSRKKSSLVLNSGAQALHLHPDSRTSIHACRILSGIDVKIDNTRLWFPSGHPAYIALKAQQEAGVGFSEHRGPCAASGSPTALRSLRFLRLSASPTLLLLQGEAKSTQRIDTKVLSKKRHQQFEGAL